MKYPVSNTTLNRKEREENLIRDILPFYDNDVGKPVHSGKVSSTIHDLFIRIHILTRRKKFVTLIFLTDFFIFLEQIYIHTKCLNSEKNEC
jgi:hypothetical protein